MTIDQEGAGMPPTAAPRIVDVTQVAVIVRDLEASMRTYVEEYGIGPWNIFEFNPSTGSAMVVDDEPTEYAMRVALTRIGSVEWELIQPLDDRSDYAAFLAQHGEGVHHVAITTDRGYDDSVQALRDKGHHVRQGGGYKGNRFVYMSTDRDLGVVTELVDATEGALAVPDAVYPPPAP
jgi:hypothetical protein